MSEFAAEWSVNFYPRMPNCKDNRKKRSTLLGKPDLVFTECRETGTNYRYNYRSGSVTDGWISRDGMYLHFDSSTVTVTKVFAADY